MSQSIPLVLALCACAFATFIEMGKLPFDLAEAEQELQEGPLSEYSGSGEPTVTTGSAVAIVSTSHTASGGTPSRRHPGQRSGGPAV
ncbi:NADH-quinone oxidoreductase subunit H [Escherichia coli]|uniref:NADH-quinone oxidoreductase subunit H n=1 Tax=Escherichia coli TaxID=562 RepID=UPI003D9A530A